MNNTGNTRTVTNEEIRTVIKENTSTLTNKNIFITGGTGTLGRAILRRAHEEKWGSSFTIFSRDPMKQAALKQMYPLSPKMRYVVGDIRDYDSLHYAIIGHDVVIHAAAQKHIPVGEANPGETLSTNITGSQNVAMAAMEAAVSQVIGISTDKVCYPANVYGISKLAMERLFIHYNQVGLTGFHLCRYGNVIGSTGSVIPLWQQQFNERGIITVTDPDMTRFWMTEDQAVNLILLASKIPPGHVVIPAAPACAMGNLANYLFPQASIDVIGKRPGEKDHECLLTTEERPRAELRGEAWILYGHPINDPGDEYPNGYHSNNTLNVLGERGLLELAGWHDE